MLPLLLCTEPRDKDYHVRECIKEPIGEIFVHDIEVLKLRR